MKLVRYIEDDALRLADAEVWQAVKNHIWLRVYTDVHQQVSESTLLQFLKTDENS